MDIYKEKGHGALKPVCVNTQASPIKIKGKEDGN